MLWFPICRLLRFPIETLRKKGRSGSSHPGITHSSLAFLDTLHKLALTLRELHQMIRLSCDHPVNLELATLTADHRANEMTPLYIDLAFSYLRRIADLLVMACGPLLFEDWKSVPQKYKKFHRNIKTGLPIWISSNPISRSATSLFSMKRLLTILNGSRRSVVRLR